MKIGLDVLKAAMRRGGRVDASAIVLRKGSPPRQLNVSNSAWGAHLPPHFTSARRLEPADSKAGPGERASARDFERLSLAARTALLSRNSPVDEVDQEDGKADSRAVSNGHARQLDEFIPPRRSDWPVVFAEDILETLAWACDEVGPDQGIQGQTRTQEQLAMRGGLQLVGVWIRSRVPGGDGLRLVNARLPFSLRLNGCVVECPLLLSHCHLVTLDLSGSALLSVDASGLVASGSVHMRRTVVVTPVMFPGATIKGIFNASQAVFAPFEPVAKQTAVELDHGMFNLSKADVDNEVLLEDTRIWGGISLRGARFRRSLNLDGAYLSSPLACFEKWACEVLGDHVAADAPNWPWAKHDDVMARSIHGVREGEPNSELAELEVLKGATQRWKHLGRHTLRLLDERALMCALRADGLKLGGSLFARGLKANGRVRMKYASMDGSIRTQGADIRSAQALRDDLAALLAGLLARTVRPTAAGMIEGQFNSLVRDARWDAERPGLALDLRSAKCAGGLHLGRYGARATRMNGRVDLSLFETDDDVDLRDVHFNLSNKLWQHRDVEAEGVRIGRDMKLMRSRSLRGINLSNAQIRGDLKFGDLARGSDGNEPYGYRPCPGRAINVEGGVVLRGATIGGDAILTFNPRSGPCIEADMIRVAGRLDIYPQPGTLTRQLSKTGFADRRMLRNGFFLDACSHRKRAKRHLRRPIDCRSTDQAPIASNGGRLEIECCKGCHAIVESKEHWNNPFIDLRNGSATVFGHPPAAWPAPGGLSLEGFTYREASDLLGPLSPEPDLKTVADRKEHSRSAMKTRRSPVSTAAGQIGVLIPAGAGLLATAAFLQAAAMAIGSRFPKPLLIIDAGIGFAMALLVVILLYFICIRFAPWSGFRTSTKTRPRALVYLTLLRKSAPRFRAAPREVGSMDPYVTAARALRESGRYISANEVEKARLRLRAVNLSWTIHWPGKATMVLTDMVVGYGFSLARGVGILAALVVMTAAYAQTQYYKDPSLFCVGSRDACLETPPATGAPGLIYALDVVLPFGDFGEQSRWRAAPERGFRMQATVPLVDDLLEFWSRSWPSVMAILGFILTTLIGLGAGARIESALANVKE